MRETRERESPLFINPVRSADSRRHSVSALLSQVSSSSSSSSSSLSTSSQRHLGRTSSLDTFREKGKRERERGWKYVLEDSKITIFVSGKVERTALDTSRGREGLDYRSLVVLCRNLNLK